ncbi:testis-expressed protein 2-like [Tachypleus tridentatus]|uniref:testis-expressed protein 2-like n=1 Tax=Tachypleus tridentatus TaxID=6853 RepID=UPI003FD2A275
MQSKFKGKQAPSMANTISFRFNPIEENLEEVPEAKETCIGKSNKVATEKGLKDSRAHLFHKTVSIQGTRKGFMKFNLTSSCEKDKNGKVVEQTKNEGKDNQRLLVEEVVRSKVDSKSMKENKVDDTLSAPLPNKDVRNSSPKKESVREYIAKLGKRTSSLDTSTAADCESRLFLGGITERLTKTAHEKMNKDSVPGAHSGTQHEERKQLFTGSQKEDYLSEQIAHVEDQVGVQLQGSMNESSLKVNTDIVEKGKECLQEEFISNSHSCMKVESTTSSESFKCALDPKMLDTSVTSSISDSSSQQVHSKVSIPSSVTFSSLLASCTSWPSSKEGNDLDTWEFVVQEEKAEAPHVMPVMVEKHEKLESVKHTNKLLKVYIDILKKRWNKASKAFRKIYNLSYVRLFVMLMSLIFATRFLPSYFSGFIMGACLSGLVGYGSWWLFRPPSMKQPLEIPDYNTLPPLKVPVGVPVEDQNIYKGWMDELLVDCEPDTYHMQSVYVCLDGSSLFLSRPKYNVSKQPMWNEHCDEPVFIHHRHYDLKGATVSLPPAGLTRKRLWNKKYPISIVIINSKIFPNEKSEASSCTLDPSSGFKMPLMDSSKKSASDTQENSQNSIKKEQNLYLFARTGREKEEWYHKFQNASEPQTEDDKEEKSANSEQNKSDVSPSKQSMVTDIDNYSRGSVVIIKEDIISDEVKKEKNLDFVTYMTALLKSNAGKITSDAGSGLHKNKRTTSGSVGKSSHDSNKSLLFARKDATLWLNAFIRRIFYDFLSKNYWSITMANKIQHKLNEIKVPSFIEELQLIEIDLGTSIPVIHRVSDPAMDQQGLWIDMDVTYQGCFKMTLKTQLNLYRFKKSQEVLMAPKTSFLEQEKLQGSDSLFSKSYVLRSDYEDGAESPSDEDATHKDQFDKKLLTALDAGAKTSSNIGTKIPKFVNKLIQSRYFQQATENKYIKQAMKEISNTPVFLTVEVDGVAGTLALNIPPAPSDRLWYGFRDNPKLSITAKPKLGEKIVNIGHITEWIEKKLASEFQKVLVIPNMDDLIIPIMHSGLKSSGSSNGS